MLQQVGEQPAFEKVSAPILAERKAEAAGQFSLFGGGDDGAGLGEIDESVLRRRGARQAAPAVQGEGDARPVRDRPSAARGRGRRCAAQTSHDVREIEDLGDGDLVTVGGIIGSLARKYTKRGEPYAQFRLEGLPGGVEVVAFPSVFEAVPELMEPDRIVLVTGRIDRRGRELQIRASEVREPDLGADGPRAAPRRSSWTCRRPRARPACSTSCGRCSSASPAGRRCACGS